MSMLIKFRKLKTEAIMPSYAHPGDVGLDLYSLEDYELKQGDRHRFDLGFALEFENNYAAIVKDKSGLSVVHGLHTIGGVFDSGYRGEYNVLLINFSDQAYQIKKGDKIAQLVIFPVAVAELEEVTELSETSRGVGRFGSTGR